MSTALHIQQKTTERNGISQEVHPSARERAWFNARIERGKRERFTENVIITPGIAALMLTLNIGNRRINRRQVALHIDRLQRGDFILTHQGMAIAKTGVLNDGQHRLTAILECGIPGEVQVTFGAEREEFRVHDQTYKRGAADQLSIIGESHAALRASVAKMLWRIKQSAVANPDPQLIADYAIELRGPVMDDALRMGAALGRLTAPTAVSVAYWWIATQTIKPRIAEFWDGLATGEGLTGAKLRLREWLRNGDIHTVDSTGMTCTKAAVIINAWNSYVSGRRTFTTTWRHVIKLPDPL